MNAQTEMQALAEALIAAIGNDITTWMRVAVWNGMQTTPHDSIARILEITHPTVANKPS